MGKEVVQRHWWTGQNLQHQIISVVFLEINVVTCASYQFFSCLILNFINTLLATYFNFHLFSKGLCSNFNEISPISLRYLNSWSSASGCLGRR